MQLFKYQPAMDKYEIFEKAGSGNFSDVYKAQHLPTAEIVAIKQMKNTDDIEDLAMKELKILSTLSHPNIIKLREVIHQPNDIKVVFEYVSQNLLELYQSSKHGINENQIKCILYQTAFALEYLHFEKKIIHRDIKPENILIDRKRATVKVIDFGLAKEQSLASTDYVATRWYRAPENLVGLRKSTTAIDIFALACVIVELFTLNPLFPGDNTIDQLYKVASILGTPSEETWPAGYYELKKKGISIAPKAKVSLANFMSGASESLVDLLEEMLILNPEKRMVARDIMQHPFFVKVERVIPGTIHQEALKYIEEINERRKKVPILKSVSPYNQVASLKYSPNQVLNIQNDSLVGEANHVPEPPCFHQFSPRNSKLQFQQFLANKSKQGGSFQFKGVQNHQSKLLLAGAMTPSRKIEPRLSQVQPVIREKRFISQNNQHNHSLEKRRSPKTQRDDEKYIGIDPSQLQSIKRRVYQQEGTTSPKYNVRYFKEAGDRRTSRNNLSLYKARSNLLLHKSLDNSHLPIAVQPVIKNTYSSKINFKS